MGEHNNNDNFKTIAKIVIKLHSNGSVEVEGPFNDKILCYGLLEMGKEIIKGHVPEQKNILVPQLVVPPGLVGKG